jgi:hypothetical protein
MTSTQKELRQHIEQLQAELINTKKELLLTEKRVTEALALVKRILDTGDVYGRVEYLQLLQEE